jgi:hypothetical protein
MAVGCPLSMILFVLYIEPLIREMSLKVSGANVGIETIKVLGYADVINFVVENDVEIDRVFEKRGLALINVELQMKV